MPRCQSLAQPKNPVEKFNSDDVELLSDPITKVNVSTKEIDYENDPWYQFLNDQVMKLNEDGLEKRKEIEELRNPQPLPPLKDKGRRITSREMFCLAITRAVVKQAMKSLETEEQERLKAEERYRKIVDRKWLKSSFFYSLFYCSTFFNNFFHSSPIRKNSKSINASNSFTRGRHATNRARRS